MHDQFGMGMSLMKALRVERGAVVSFVGGGGKTTSMFRLASELTAAGLRVVTTTTTHISEEQVRHAPASILYDQLDMLEACLDQYGHCLVIGPPDGKGRVRGASSELIAKLKARTAVNVILVEADGSRSRPFKAPGEHEPVVPEVTTITAPVVGLNSIGLPLTEEHVHRSEIVASLAQQQIGSPITCETIARVLSHPEGGAKHSPACARLVPILNKADVDIVKQHAGNLARKLMASAAVDSVIISTMNEDPPVRETWTSVGGIVLAAGQATRFGSTKQILPWAGTNLVAHCTRVAIDAGLDPVIAVIGYDADSVAKALADLPVQMVFNPEFAEGQSTSLRRGVEALPSRTGAALFLLADQPFVTKAMLKMILWAHRRTLAPACVPVFNGRRGNPILFDRTLFPELRNLHGDTGGRALLEKYRDTLVSIPASRAALLDIDTIEDYERFRRIYPRVS